MNFSVNVSSYAKMDRIIDMDLCIFCICPMTIFLHFCCISSKINGPTVSNFMFLEQVVVETRNNRFNLRRHGVCLCAFVSKVKVGQPSRLGGGG